MLIKESEVILTEGLAIHWESVDTLRVLNDRLIFRMKDGIQLEVAGLPLREVDQVFAEWSRFIRNHPQT
jgi:hypothetical protein